MSTAVDVLIVGSGPVGAAHARLIAEHRPDATILMVDLGPRLTDPPGVNVRNLADEAERSLARTRSQGREGGATGFASPFSIEGTITARQGTHLVDPDAAASANGTGMPAAAVSSCVGGQGAHWTCATPRPRDSERIGFIPDAEWDAAVAEAERLLGTTRTAFADSPAGRGTRAILSELFDPLLPGDRAVGILPVAGRVADGGRMVWSGTDTVLGPLGGGAGGFELRAETICRRLEVDGGTVRGAVLEHLPTGREERVIARAIVVAADALRTPQLLWASGIRSPALGRHLTEHPLAFAVVALDERVLARAGDGGARVATPLRDATADPVSAVTWVPFADPAHPFHGQVMHMESCPFPVDPADLPPAPAGFASLGWGCRKQPRPEDRVVFSETDTDAYGMPRMRIEYEVTDRERAELEQATAEIARAAAALGAFVPGGEPRVLPAGTSLHYSGTIRMGAADDGASVCDSEGRVWGHDGLFVGGNGVIPTATACNPTLTSVALATRSARRVLERLS